MKILLTNFHPNDGGGHDTYLYHLAMLLSENHHITVAAPPTSRLLKKVEKLSNVKTIAVFFTTKLKERKHFFRTFRLLRRLFVTEKYDIVHVNGSPDHKLVLLAGLFLRKRFKVVFTKHHSLPIKASALFRYRYFTDVIIAVSHATKKLFPVNLINSVKVIENGVNTGYFKPLVDHQQYLTLRGNYGITSDTLVIGSIAGTAIYKGWWLLLDALAAIHQQCPVPLKVMIAGYLPSKDEQKRYVDDNGLQDIVIFTDWIDDVREVIACFDLGFVLSYSIETISFACRQMMAMAKPVIVSDYAGLPENITAGQDGWITKVKDVDSIKACLLTIFSELDQLPTKSHHAREKAVNAFSEKQWFEKTLQVYTQACEK